MGCTHGHHKKLEDDIIKSNPDVIIHTGDHSNNSNPFINIHESEDFLNWYNDLNVTANKIFIAGNHDTAIYKKLIDLNNYDKLIYLQDNDVIIDGIKFYGTPWMPIYGNWVFMTNDNKLLKIYNKIPADTDVLITHSPPKTIQDLSYKPNGNIEFCGSKHLLNKVLNIDPKIHCFSHIHDVNDITNNGIKKLSKNQTLFVNAACCKDREIDTIKHTGHIITLF